MTERDRGEQRSSLLAGKKAAFWVVVAVCAGVVLLGGVLGRPDRLIGIMVGFYGAMLSLLPAVIAMLCKSGRWNGGAVAAGMVVGVAAAVSFSVWGIFDPSMAWYGVFAAPLIALAIPVALSPFMADRQRAA